MRYSIGLPSEVTERLNTIRGKEGIIWDPEIHKNIMRISAELSKEIEMDINREELDWYGRVWAGQCLDQDSIVSRITDFYNSAERTDDPRIKLIKFEKVGAASLLASAGIGLDKKSNSHHLSGFDYIELSRVSYKGASKASGNPLLARVSDRVHEFSQLTAIINHLCLQGDYQAVWDLINFRKRALSTAGAGEN